MTRVLVVVAHPDLSRSRVNAAWTRALLEDGRATVRVLTDTLVGDGFDAVAEQRALAAHDRIVLQFPFRWYSCPPLLKTWIDQVLERGWAYEPGGHALEGKELTVAVSTWSRASDYTTEGRYGRTMSELLSPFEVTALRVGMSYRPGFHVHDVGALSDADLAVTAKRLVEWVVAP